MGRKAWVWGTGKADMIFLSLGCFCIVRTLFDEQSEMLTNNNAIYKGELPFVERIKGKNKIGSLRHFFL